MKLIFVLLMSVIDFERYEMKKLKMAVGVDVKEANYFG